MLITCLNFLNIQQKKGRNLSNATKEDVQGFLSTKSEVAAKSYNYFHKKYLNEFNPNLKGLDKSQVIQFTLKIEDPIQGARQTDVNTKENTITIIPSKGTSKTARQVVISEGFTKILEEVFKYNLIKSSKLRAQSFLQ